MHDLSLGIAILMVSNCFQIQLILCQDENEENGATMMDFCFGITGQIYCSCDPSEIEIKSAFCTLFYDPPPEDPIWIRIKENSLLTKLHLRSLQEGLTAMPTNVINRNVLREFTVEYGNIKTIPSFAFQNSTVIRFITLSHNKITYLEPYSFAYLQSVDELALSENDITTIKKNTFSQLPKLKILKLDRNKINAIEDGAFIGLNSLQELDLMMNSVQDLKAGLFKDMTNLNRLDLGMNQLRHLRRNSFEGLSRVHVIDLRDNQMESIDAESFRGVPNLMTLYLTRNKLAHLHHDTFKPLTKLAYLDLAQNRLETLTEKTVMPIYLHNTSTVYLLVADNEFVCDCRIQWMLKMSNLSSEWTTVKCFPPHQNQHHPIFSNKKKEEVRLTESTFNVQANEKHTNPEGISISNAKEYLENCPDPVEEDRLHKTSNFFVRLTSTGTIDNENKQNYPDPDEEDNLDVTPKTVTKSTSSTKAANFQTKHNFAFTIKNSITLNVLIYLLLMLLSV